MFWILPSLILIGITSIGIVIIGWRKFPYLRKLAPEAHEVGETMWHDLFPELFSWYGRLPTRELRDWRLRETEKLLRKVRLVFSKIDRVSYSLIHQVRREHLEQNIKLEPESKPFIPEANSRPKSQADIMEDLKKEEQRLIIEIAKTPKDGELYIKLGDTYMSMNNFSDAKEAFEEAMDLDPENKTLHRKLSVAIEKIAKMPVS
ncbi:MAG: tetratricopeptide repeat protein [Candidatus Yanofskybacteria bacterium]|nr:tetratricopeptide repeat protein [Candidatus Yanofskybacteria bacterium]